MMHDCMLQLVTLVEHQIALGAEASIPQLGLLGIHFIADEEQLTCTTLKR